MIFMVTFMWTAEAGVLIANDEFGKEIVRVNTGGTHWDFQFTDIGGNGRIRVGAGCNYTPLSMIQEMFHQVSSDEGIQPPAGDVFFDDISDLPDDFIKDWE